MSRPNLNISIPKPCHEPWDKMDAAERGAFCHSCQKVVVDFSTMTDREVIEYLSKQNVSCGRFRKDQVERTITIPKVETGFIRWRTLLLGLLPVFAFEDARASIPVKAPTDQTPVDKKCAVDSTLTAMSDKISVCGKVIGDNRIPIPNASVEVHTAGGGFNGNGAVSDSKGDFEIEMSKAEFVNGLPFLRIITGQSERIITLNREAKQNYTVRLFDPEHSYIAGGMGYAIAYYEIKKPTNLIQKLIRKNKERQQIAEGQICVYGKIKEGETGLANISIRVVDTMGIFCGNGAVTDSAGEYTIYLDKKEHKEKKFHLEISRDGFHQRNVSLNNDVIQEQVVRLYSDGGKYRSRNVLYKVMSPMTFSLLKTKRRIQNWIRNKFQKHPKNHVVGRF